MVQFFLSIYTAWRFSLSFSPFFIKGYTWLETNDNRLLFQINFSRYFTILYPNTTWYVLIKGWLYPSFIYLRTKQSFIWTSSQKICVFLLRTFCRPLCRPIRSCNNGIQWKGKKMKTKQSSTKGHCLALQSVKCELAMRKKKS